MGESTEEEQIRYALTRLAGDSRIYRQLLREVRPAIQLLAQDYQPIDPLLPALRLLEDWSRYAERLALAALQDLSR